MKTRSAFACLTLALALQTAHAACALDAPPADFPAALARLASCNRDVRLAEGAARAAAADVLTANRAPNPVLTLGATQLGGTPSKFSGSDFSVRIDQPFERGDKRELRTEAASATQRTVHWLAAEQLRQQRLTLAQAWIDLWSAQERARLIDTLLDLYHKNQGAAETRLKVGDIAANDLARIQLDTQKAESDRLLAQADLQRARHALAGVLALEGLDTQLAARPWANADEQHPQATPAADTITRPDLLAARAFEETAAANRKLAQSLQTRDFSVGMQLDRYPAPLGEGNVLGLTLSVPLFTRHRYEGEIARAEQDELNAGLARDKLERQAVLEQATLADTLAAAAGRWHRANDDALPLAQKIAANADLAYRKGAAGVLDLLDALRQLRQAQLDAIAARADYDRADAAFRLARLDLRSDPLFGSPAPTDK